MKKLALVVGALTGCLVLSCMGFCLLASELSPSANPEPTSTPTSIATPTTIPTPQPEPIASPTLKPFPTRIPTTAPEGDRAFALCFVEIASGGVELSEAMGLVFGIASEEPGYLCVYLADAGLSSRALALQGRASQCPEPSTPCFREVKRLTVKSFEQTAISMSLFDKWCETENLLDISLIEQGYAYTVVASELAQQAADLSGTCVGQ